jgi:hypothetical protein
VKTITFILSFYLLILSGIACCSFDQCPDDKALSRQSSTHEEEDDKACDNCSPFFSCGVCAAVSATVEPLYSSIASLPVKQVYTGFLSPSIADVHYDFWQPPRLG